ncbi:DUF488 domain-containing protein [Patescibacteria group bacterium]|nr:DUF488 domain-containing protein [Patescibacteria group bacterium]
MRNIRSVSCGGNIGAENFFRLLKAAEVDVLVDARRGTEYRGARFADGRDLPYLCELHGIRYEHMLELAPSHKLRDMLASEESKPSVEADENAWTRYLEGFVKEMTTAKVLRADGPLRELLASTATTVAFMCACPHPQDCHRRAVVGLIERFVEGIDVRHLMPSDIGQKDPKHCSPRRYLRTAIPSACLEPNLPRQPWMGR